MKLKNKISGEIKEFTLFDGKELQGGITLESLTKEWEDYEEPEMFYWIGYDGKICKAEIGTMDRTKIKEIGNYFDTREEAEKAVEKLKAWKRLKDKGISFEVKVIDRKWYLEPKAEPQWRTFDESNDLYKDIMFVFGVEE